MVLSEEEYGKTAEKEKGKKLLNLPCNSAIAK